MNRPEAKSNYIFCRGESPVQTHICEHREKCKRFLPNGYGINYKDFWIAADCPNYESKPKADEEPPKVDW